jgi:hypothetical protein
MKKKKEKSKLDFKKVTVLEFKEMIQINGGYAPPVIDLTLSKGGKSTVNCSH